MTECVKFSVVSIDTVCFKRVLLPFSSNSPYSESFTIGILSDILHSTVGKRVMQLNTKFGIIKLASTCSKMNNL